MPALLAVCNSCQFRFSFDYDFRQQRCSKCGVAFDWRTNPTQVDSPRGSFTESGTAPIRGDSAYRRPTSTPRLPGEPGYEEYSRAARQDHEASRLRGEQVKTEE